MSIWSNIFPSPKSIEKGMDAMIKAGDKLVYTKQEKTEGSREFFLKVQSLAITFYEAMTPYNATMRFLAMGVFVPWVICLFLAVTFSVLGFFACDSDACAAVVSGNYIWGVMKTSVDPYFDKVMTFYFASALVNGAIRTYKGDTK